MDFSGYQYSNATHGLAHKYLLPVIQEWLLKLVPDPSRSRILDLGSGNGSVAKYIHDLGYSVEGVDPSSEGIALARANFPMIVFSQADTSTPIENLGKYDLVYSLEVIEHVYDPYKFMEHISKELRDDGYAIISTPYHGYTKNICLAILGKFDSHATALWIGGHIKFWSVKTLTTLCQSQNFKIVKVLRIGRIPVLAKSMIFIIQKESLSSY